MIELKKSLDFAGPKGAVVLVIMDGVGIGKNPESDFVKQANTPNLNWLHDNALYTELCAHGVSVGLPDDGDMGNSEVGHNARCMRMARFGKSWLQTSMPNPQLCILLVCCLMAMSIPTSTTWNPCYAQRKPKALKQPLSML